MYNETVERITVLKTASSARSEIGNDFLPLKSLGFGIRASSQLLKKLR
jgi:hypothetical protein